MLTWIKYVDNNKWDYSRSLYRCDCGEEKIIVDSDVKRGHTKSCGCLRKRTKGRPKVHGHESGGRMSPTYDSWASMKKRCLNKSHKFYKNYGGRGIKICESWMKFENFLRDMGVREVGYSIDRIDNDGNYEPNNCRWILRAENSSRRKTCLL